MVANEIVRAKELISLLQSRARSERLKSGKLVVAKSRLDELGSSIRLDAEKMSRDFTRHHIASIKSGEKILNDVLALGKIVQSRVEDRIHLDHLVSKCTIFARQKITELEDRLCERELTFKELQARLLNLTEEIHSHEDTYHEAQLNLRCQEEKLVETQDAIRETQEHIDDLNTQSRHKQADLDQLHAQLDAQKVAINLNISKINQTLENQKVNKQDIHQPKETSQDDDDDGQDDDETEERLTHSAISARLESLKLTGIVDLKKFEEFEKWCNLEIANFGPKVLKEEKLIKELEDECISLDEKLLSTSSEFPDLLTCVADIKTIDDQISQARAEMQRIQQEIDACEASIEKEKADELQYKEDIQSLTESQIQPLEKSLDKVKSEREMCQKRILNLRHEIKATREIRASIEQKIEDRQAQADLLKAQLESDIQDQINRVELEHLSDQSHLDQIYHELNDIDLDSLRQEVDIATTNLKQTLNREADASALCHDLQLSLVEAERDVQNLTADLAREKADCENCSVTDLSKAIEDEKHFIRRYSRLPSHPDLTEDTTTAGTSPASTPFRNLLGDFSQEEIGWDEDPYLRSLLDEVEVDQPTFQARVEQLLHRRSVADFERRRVQMLKEHDLACQDLNNAYKLKLEAIEEQHQLDMEALQKKKRPLMQEPQSRPPVAVRRRRHSPSPYLDEPSTPQPPASPTGTNASTTAVVARRPVHLARLSAMRLATPNTASRRIGMALGQKQSSPARSKATKRSLMDPSSAESRAIKRRMSLPGGGRKATMLRQPLSKIHKVSGEDLFESTL